MHCQSAVSVLDVSVGGGGGAGAAAGAGAGEGAGAGADGCTVDEVEDADVATAPAVVAPDPAGRLAPMTCGQSKSLIDRLPAEGE